MELLHSQVSQDQVNQVSYDQSGELGQPGELGSGKTDEPGLGKTGDLALNSKARYPYTMTSWQERGSYPKDVPSVRKQFS